uniref:Uncharacterized protein n=1 Tax=Chromera velia CCMP2878 TaxID=1169474 RepID=A0A0G4FWQ1_9ALVE|eukprot:Cvel_3838.t1-p1 / transcript=Cvel_3838.t1 / gene=Cvel_3838 / organism=Chromera_velia_CCMP2878 / gene_product=hypothetical protein / transcript_product=hypothetical protein / location=Cvel_scaffold162:65806-66603(-) / protein_length=266 / sequence_SO=supercontig / SO=protein_coding / is_pseudo=false
MQPYKVDKREEAKVQGTTAGAQNHLERWTLMWFQICPLLIEFEVLDRGKKHAADLEEFTKLTAKHVAPGTNLIGDGGVEFREKSLARLGIYLEQTAHSRGVYVLRGQSDSVGNPKSQLHAEARFRPLRLFISKYGLQRQQHEDDPTVLEHYLAEFATKVEEGWFHDEDGLVFAKLIQILVEVHAHRGFPLVRAEGKGKRQRKRKQSQIDAHPADLEEPFRDSSSDPSSELDSSSEPPQSSFLQREEEGEGVERRTGGEGRGEGDED